MSPMTILATLALASPTNESGPVWSAMTPTLMGRALEVAESAMILSFGSSVGAWRNIRSERRDVGSPRTM